MKNKAKLRLMALILASLVGASSKVESCAFEGQDKEIVSLEDKLEKSTYVKALEDLNVYDSVECNNIIGTMKSGNMQLFNCLWDEGFYEVEYNDGLGYVECNKCDLVSKYNFENMFVTTNETNMYVENPSDGETKVVKLDKHSVGGLIKNVGSWALVSVDDQFGFIKSSDLEILTSVFAIVDKSDFKLKLYVDNSLVLESPVIVGRKKHQTDEGIFEVYNKVRDYTMVGENNSYQAFSKYVVMYNNKSKEYLHDASWKSEEDFAKAAELPDNMLSHGCCNLKNDDAKKVYEYMNKGDKVIVIP